MIIDRSTPLWDTELSDEERISWLLSQMNIEEKISWISGFNRDLERIGVPGFSLGGEAAHGIQARNDEPVKREPDVTTSFVQPIGMSATWDPELLEEAGRVTGTEGRIVAQRHDGYGLSRWAPTIDLERDARWGRNEEAYGEDPYLTGKMAAAYVRGMQGNDPRYLRVASTLKHFYGNNTERGRGWKSSVIDPRNFYDSYLEPFRRVITEGKAVGVMTAYNRINGIPGIMNPQVLKILKKEYKLEHAVGDGSALDMSQRVAHQYGTLYESLAEAMKNGVDSMSDKPHLAVKAVREAYELGLIHEEDLDKAIGNVMKTKLRLGLYDREMLNPYANVPEDQLCCDEHKEICLQVSKEAFVLLKNDKGLLPLEVAEGESVLLAGPWADAWRQDWYGGEPPCRTTLRKALEDRHCRVRVDDGFDRIILQCGNRFVCCDENGTLRLGEAGTPLIAEDWGNGNLTLRNSHTGKMIGPRHQDEKTVICADRNESFSWFSEEIVHLVPDLENRYLLQTRFEVALSEGEDGLLLADPEGKPLEFKIITVERGTERIVQRAKEAEHVVLAMGCHPMINAKEQIDRVTLDLPPVQENLIRAVLDCRPDTPMILFSNYPYALHDLAEKLPAILWTATGAQDLGEAAAAVLLGEYNPGGRLNMTWPADDRQLPDIDDYDLIKGKRTYRYFDGEPLYPFGYGLSYTDFRYDLLSVSYGKGEVDLSFTVTNTGDRTGDEVCQVYRTAIGINQPIRQLIGFKRIRNLKPGEEKKIEFNIPEREFMHYDPARGSMTLETGEYRIMVGSSSQDVRLTGTLVLKGQEPVIRDLSRWTAADTYDDHEHVHLTKGHLGYSALLVAEGYEAAKAVYTRCDRRSLGENIRCHVLAEKEGGIEIILNGHTAGTWEGNTLDYCDRETFMPDSLTRMEESARISMQKPQYTDVAVKTDLSVLGENEATVCLEIRLRGDIRLCYFKCE